MASDFSDFVVYAEESDDLGLVAIDPQYPVFELVFCKRGERPTFQLRF